MRSMLTVFLTWIGLAYGYGPAGYVTDATQDTSAAAGLKIVVLEGEDGVNIVKKKSAVKPVVEVRDKDNLPVAGASVLFLLPDSGPTATLASGGHSLTVLTNSAGRATITNMKPVGTGSFKINVTASFRGQTATSTISQTNYLTVAAANAAGATTAGTVAGGTGGGLSGAAIIGIIAGVAAAAGVAIAVATKGGGSKSPGSVQIPTGTIGGGSGPVFNPPH